MNPVLIELFMIIAVAAVSGVTVWGSVRVAHALLYGRQLKAVKQNLEDSKNGSSFSELIEQGPRDSGTFEQVD